MHKCANCSGEIRSLYHDPKNHDIRTNIGVDMEGRVMHIQCPPKEAE